MRSNLRLHRRATYRLAAWLKSWLTGWLGVALVFMQLAVSAYACPMAQGTASDNASNMAGANAMPDCAGNSLLAMDPAQPLLCLAHCQQGAQAAQPTATLDAPASPVLLAVLDWSPLALLPGTLQATAGNTPTARWGASPPGAPSPGSPPIYLALLVLRN